MPKQFVFLIFVPRLAKYIYNMRRLRGLTACTVCSPVVTGVVGLSSRQMGRMSYNW